MSLHLFASFQSVRELMMLSACYCQWMRELMMLSSRYYNIIVLGAPVFGGLGVVAST